MDLDRLRRLAGIVEDGPIIGAPKGSQKDSKMGTDEPSKYMRGGEWEAYREPQGVSSDAGKIAGGRKGGETKSKNKKMSESQEALDAILNKSFGFWYNPYENYVLPDQEWSDPENGHSRAAIHDLYIDDLQGYQQRAHDDMYALETAMRHGWIRGVNAGSMLMLQGIDEKHSADAYKALADYFPMFPELQTVELATLDGAGNKSVRVNEASEMGTFAGGPGHSGDLVPRHRDATTMNMVKDTNGETRNRVKMDGSESPLKMVKQQVKKQNTNESIRRQRSSGYSAEYDLRDNNDVETLGTAVVTDGVIEVLAVRNDLNEEHHGQFLSRLLSTIVRDADMANANLAIGLKDPDDLTQKRFLERFGFRETQGGVMKRNAGAITPPSVQANRTI